MPVDIPVSGVGCGVDEPVSVADATAGAVAELVLNIEDVELVDDMVEEVLVSLAESTWSPFAVSQTPLPLLQHASSLSQHQLPSPH